MSGCTAGLLMSDPGATNVIASRARTLEEVARSPADLREYLATRCRELLGIRDFSNYLPGLIADDLSLTLTDEVLQRLRAIATAQG